MVEYTDRCLIEGPSAATPELSRDPSLKAWIRSEYSLACFAHVQKLNPNTCKFQKNAICWDKNTIFKFSG